MIGDWRVRLGELKISGGRAHGKVRGCVCEVGYFLADNGEQRDSGEIESLARAFFEDLVQGSGVDARGMKVIAPVAGAKNGLVRQYMDLLEFASS